MEAGANTLAFVLLAIRSAKLIHTVLRSIKDGPENVRRTADDVAGLLSALEQLSRCRALEKRGCEPLEARLLRCVDDLEAFNGDIKKLEVGDDEGKRVRYWKRVKAAWGERRLEGMRVVVSGHCAALNLQLSALQSDAVFDMSDQLRAIDDRLLPQGTIGEVPGQLRTITEELVSQRTVRETETLLWREQQTISAQVSENVVGIRGGVDTIGRELHAMSASYASRDTQVIERLDEILYQILNLKLEGQHARRVVEVEDGVKDNTGGEEELRSVFPADQKTTGPCLWLMESIKRLCHVVGREQGRPAIGGDRDVIAALLAMLQCMVSEEFLRDAASSGAVSSGCCQDCSAHHLQDLKACLLSVHGNLASSQRVMLNQSDQTRQRAQGGYTQYQSTTSAYDMGIATIVVSSRRRVRALNSGRVHSKAPLQWSSPLEDVSTSITIVPSANTKAKQMLKLTTRRLDEGHGVFLSIPVLWVNKVLPSDAPIFSVVREGRLEELMALLQDGDASIRVHDEDGASLLHCAAGAGQPAMCQFLIESGADVDCVVHVRVGPDNESSLVSPLRYSIAAGDSKWALVCRGLLLDAGCDPAIPVFPSHMVESVGTDAFGHSFFKGSIDMMKMMLEKGSPFVGVHTSVRSMTPLMLYSISASWQMEGFALLVRHGASVRDRVIHGGLTCLHYCFMSITHNDLVPHNEVRRKRDAIIYLIQQGADVFAKNHLGHSVSDIAYNANYFKLGSPTSWIGDIWDCALANCGYDVSDFRRGRKRQGVYDAWYTRDDFEDLWAGSEHLCPYYDPQEDDRYISDSYDELVSSESDSEEGGVPL